MHVKSSIAFAVVFSSTFLMSQTAPRIGASDSGTAAFTGHEPGILLSGRVRLPDGAPPPQEATIQCSCGGAARSLGYTGPSGDFAVQMGEGEAARTADLTNLSVDSETALTAANWNHCEVSAALPGFSSSHLSLASLGAAVGAVNAGTIILTPISKNQGFTVSAADYAAPDKARKELDAGRKEEKKGKWASAREKLQRALSIYSRFPLAWIELGRVQIQENDIDSARTSFRNALNVDPRLVAPYAELALLDMQEKNWPAVAEDTGRVLEMDPSSPPQFWFLNAVANYNAKRFDSAEKSALRGISLDSTHRMPEMEYILGLVLGAKKQYQQAAEHMRSFLQLAPMHPDAVQARDQLNQLQRLAERGEAQ